MKRSFASWAPSPRNPYCAMALALLLPWGAAAVPTVLNGADILEHPCGKVGVKQMGLLNQGKVEEANALASPEMRMQWEKTSAVERSMMAGMAKAISPTEAEFAASIRSHGVLTIDGTAATLKVEKKTTTSSGSSTSTTTQRFRMNGASCLVDK